MKVVNAGGFSWFNEKMDKYEEKKILVREKIFNNTIYKMTKVMYLILIIMSALVLGFVLYRSSIGEMSKSEAKSALFVVVMMICIVVSYILEKKMLTACYKQTMQEIEQEKAVVAHLYDIPLIGVKLIDDGKNYGDKNRVLFKFDTNGYVTEIDCLVRVDDAKDEPYVDAEELIVYIKL